MLARQKKSLDSDDEEVIQSASLTNFDIENEESKIFTGNNETDIKRRLKKMCHKPIKYKIEFYK